MSNIRDQNLGVGLIIPNISKYIILVNSDEFWWILMEIILKSWKYDPIFQSFTKIIHQDMGNLLFTKIWGTKTLTSLKGPLKMPPLIGNNLNAKHVGMEGRQTPETWRALLQVMTCYDWVVQIGSQYLNVMNYIMDSSEHCKKWGDTNSYFTPLDWLLNPSEHTKDPSSWSRGPSRTASPFRTDPDLIFLRLLSAQNSSKTLPRGKQALHGTAVAVVYSS